MINFVLVIYRR